MGILISFYERADNKQVLAYNSVMEFRHVNYFMAFLTATTLNCCGFISHYLYSYVVVLFTWKKLWCFSARLYNETSTRCFRFWDIRHYFFSEILNHFRNFYNSLYWSESYKKHKNRIYAFQKPIPCKLNAALLPDYCRALLKNMTTKF